MFGLFGSKKEEKPAEGVEQPLISYNTLLTQTQLDKFYSVKRIVLKTIYEKHLTEFFPNAENLTKILPKLAELAAKAQSDKMNMELANFLQSQIQDLTDYWPLKNYLIDDFAFYRHLKEYGWNENGAAKGMIKALLWHLRNQPSINEKYTLDSPDVKEMAKTGYFFTSGFDNKGRAVLYLQLGKDFPKVDDTTKDVKFRHIVNVFENAMFNIMKKNKLLQKGQGNGEKREGMKNPFQAQVTWIGDAQNFPVSVNYIMAIKTVIDKFGQMHAESSGRMIIVNPPFVANFIIPLIKPFLNKEQQEKYIFISGSRSKVKQEILKYIDEDQIPSEFYDGTSEHNFNLEKEIQNDKERFDTMKSLSPNSSPILNAQEITEPDEETSPQNCEN